MNKSIFSAYYGAANGFTGFRSYFKEIFNPKDFERIYVLKGGPGTGKSSLMKKIKSHFKNERFSLDEIYCSSDPSSFDGIIIYGNSKKIAVLDGTAPHETDAKIPGAIDEIINLGEMWDRNCLMDSRNKIELLNDKKRKSYESAYEYLSLAGEFYNHILSVTNTIFDNNLADSIISSIVNIPVLNRSRSIHNRLISSFSKYGYKSISIDKSVFDKCYSVYGKFASQYIFMNQVVREAERKKTDYYIFPSPYSDNLIEAIYIVENNTFIMADADFDNRINAEDCLNNDIISKSYEKLSFFESTFQELLARAKTEFSNASESHFALEAIYTPAMNFDKLNQAANDLIADISSLFWFLIFQD